MSLWNAENVSSEGVRFKTSEAGPEPPETEKKKPYPVNAYNMFSKVVWAKLSETRGKVRSLRPPTLYAGLALLSDQQDVPLLGLCHQPTVAWLEAITSTLVVLCFTIGCILSSEQ